jgi:hypothetical protein
VCNRVGASLCCEWPHLPALVLTFVRPAAKPVQCTLRRASVLPAACIQFSGDYRAQYFMRCCCSLLFAPTTDDVRLLQRVVADCCCLCVYPLASGVLQPCYSSVSFGVVVGSLVPQAPTLLSLKSQSSTGVLTHSCTRRGVAAAGVQADSVGS